MRLEWFNRLADAIFPTVPGVGNETPAVGTGMLTLLSGEDQTNNVLKVEQRFSSTYIATATTTTVKSGSGFLHALVITETAAGAITVYDNTAGSGTILAAFKASVAEATYIFDLTFATGLTIVTAGASKVTAVWR